MPVDNSKQTFEWIEGDNTSKKYTVDRNEYMKNPAAFAKAHPNARLRMRDSQGDMYVAIENVGREQKNGAHFKTTVHPVYTKPSAPVQQSRTGQKSANAQGASVGKAKSTKEQAMQAVQGKWGAPSYQPKTAEVDTSDNTPKSVSPYLTGEITKNKAITPEWQKKPQGTAPTDTRSPYTDTKMSWGERTKKVAQDTAAKHYTEDVSRPYIPQAMRQYSSTIDPIIDDIMSKADVESRKTIASSENNTLNNMGNATTAMLNLGGMKTAGEANAKNSPEAIQKAIDNYDFASVSNRLFYKTNEKGQLEYSDMVKKGAKEAGMTEDQYVKNVASPAVGRQIQARLDKNIADKSKVKGYGDYLARKLTESFVGQAVMLGMTTKGQRQQSAQATQNYEKKLGFMGKVGGVVAQTLGDAALYTAGGVVGNKALSVGAKAIEKVAPKAAQWLVPSVAKYGTGEAATHYENFLLANLAKPQLYARLAARGAVSGSANMGFVMGTQQAMQEISTGEDTSLASIGRAFLDGATEGVKFGATMAATGPLGQIMSARAASGLARVGATVGGKAVELGTLLGMDWMKEGDNFDFTESLMNNASMLVGMSFGTKMANGASLNPIKAVREIWHGTNASALKLTDTEKKFLKENFPDNSLVRLADAAMVDDKALNMENMDMALDAERLIRETPWTLRQKMGAALTKTVDGSRPYYDHFEVKGNEVYMYAKDGEMIDIQHYTNGDELLGAINSEQMRTDHNKVAGKLGAIMTADSSDEKQNEIIQAASEVGTPNGYTPREVLDLVQKGDPLKMNDEERGLVAQMGERLTAIQTKMNDGVQAPEASAELGEQASRTANLTGENPNPQPLEDINVKIQEGEKKVNEARQALATFLDGDGAYLKDAGFTADDVTPETIQKLQGVSMSDAHLQMFLDVLKAENNLGNARVEKQAFVGKTAQEIDEKIDTWFAGVGHRGNITGEDGQPVESNGNVAIMGEVNGKRMYILDGDYTEGQGMKAGESGMIICRDEEGNIEAVPAEEIKNAVVVDKNTICDPMRQSEQERVTAENPGLMDEEEEKPVGNTTGTGAEGNSAEAVPQQTGQEGSAPAEQGANGTGEMPQGEGTGEPPVVTGGTGQGENPTLSVEAPQGTEQTGEGANAQEPNTAETQSAYDRIPKDEKTGKAQWEQAEPTDTYDALMEKSNGNEKTAHRLITNMVKATEEKLQKAQKAYDKGAKATDDPDVMMAEEAQLQADLEAAQARHDYWKKVAEEPQRRMNEEIARQEAEAKAAEEAARQKLNKSEEQAFEELNAKYNANKKEGRSDTMTLKDENGTEIKGKYMLTDADDVTPTHDPETFEQMPGVPKRADGSTINDNDYKNNKQAQADVQQQAAAYDQRALQDTPIVSHAGITYSGNGRTMASRLAAKNGTDEKYINYLLENADKWGFKREDIEKMIAEGKHPRIVFEVDEELPFNTETYAMFNKDDKKRKSDTEDTVALSKILKDREDVASGIGARINSVDNLSTFYQDAEKCKELVQYLKENGVILKGEVAEWLGDGGTLSDKGKRRLETMLTGIVLNEDAIRTLNNPENGLGNVRRNIAFAIIELSKNQKLGEYKITEDLNTAIELFNRAKQAGAKTDADVMQWATELDMFEGKAPAEDYTFAQLLLGAQLAKSPKAFKAMVKSYNEQARENALGHYDVFTGKQDREQLIEQISKDLGYDTERLKDFIKRSKEGNDALKGNLGGSESGEGGAGNGTGKEGSDAEPAVGEGVGTQEPTFEKVKEGETLKEYIDRNDTASLGVNEARREYFRQTLGEDKAKELDKLFKENEPVTVTNARAVAEKVLEITGLKSGKEAIENAEGILAAFGEGRYKSDAILPFLDRIAEKPNTAVRVEGDKVIGKYGEYDLENAREDHRIPTEDGDYRDPTDEELVKAIEQEEADMLKAVGGKVPEGLTYVGQSEYWENDEPGEGFSFVDKDGNTFTCGAESKEWQVVTEDSDVFDMLRNETNPTLEDAKKDLEEAKVRLETYNKLSKAAHNVVEDLFYDYVNTEESKKKGLDILDKLAKGELSEEAIIKSHNEEELKEVSDDAKSVLDTVTDEVKNNVLSRLSTEVKSEFNGYIPRYKVTFTDAESKAYADAARDKIIFARLAKETGNKAYEAKAKEAKAAQDAVVKKAQERTAKEKADFEKKNAELVGKYKVGDRYVGKDGRIYIINSVNTKTNRLKVRGAGMTIFEEIAPADIEGSKSVSSAEYEKMKTDAYAETKGKIQAWFADKTHKYTYDDLKAQIKRDKERLKEEKKNKGYADEVWMSRLQGQIDASQEALDKMSKPKKSSKKGNKGIVDPLFKLTTPDIKSTDDVDYDKLQTIPGMSYDRLGTHVVGLNEIIEANEKELSQLTGKGIANTLSDILSFGNERSKGRLSENEKLSRINELNSRLSKLKLEQNRRILFAKNFGKKYNISKDGSISLKDLKRIFDDYNKDDYRQKIFYKLLPLIEKRMPNIKFKMFAPLSRGAEGYATRWNSVRYSLDALSSYGKGEIAQVITHELLHNATEYLIEGRHGLLRRFLMNKDTKKAVDTIERIYDIISKHLPKEYAATSPSETLAEITDDKIFQFIKEGNVDKTELQNALGELYEDKPLVDTVFEAVDTLITHQDRRIEILGKITHPNIIGKLMEKIAERFNLSFNFSGDGNAKFVGERGAENVGNTDYNVAEEMEKKGKDALAIKVATGWERGADGKWRYEMPDGNFKDNWRGEDDGMDWDVEDYTLGEIWDDKSLFEAYPDMKNTKVTVRSLKDGTRGSYKNGSNTIELSKDITPEEMRSTMLHEIQHAIQHREGFSTGTSPDSSMAKEYAARMAKEDADVEEFKQGYRDLQQGLDEATHFIKDNLEGHAFIEGRTEKMPEYKALSEEAQDYVNYYLKGGFYDHYSNWDNFVVHEWQGLQEMIDEADSEYRDEYYHNKGGEVESRNVQFRADMSDEERRNTLALSTEDVDRDKQIIGADENGVSASKKTPLDEVTEGPDVLARREPRGLSTEGKARMEIYGNKELVEARKELKAIAKEFGGQIENASAGAFNYSVEGSKDRVHGVADAKKARDISRRMVPALKEYRDELHKARAEFFEDNECTVGAMEAWNSTLAQVDKAVKYYEEFGQGQHQRIGDHDDSGVRYRGGEPNTVAETKQEKQIKSEKFKNWFGDWEKDPENASKIVDENGEPKVVYHGTPWGGFNTFQLEEGGFHYVTPDKGYADDYAHKRDEFYDPEQGGTETNPYWKPEIKELYADMKNPLDLGDVDNGFTKDYEEKLCKQLGISVDDFRKNYADHYWIVNGTNENAPVYEVINNPEFAKLLKEKGYDGIIGRENGSVGYGVIDPSQLKSATENNGEFDKNNPDIRYRTNEERPETDAEMEVFHGSGQKFEEFDSDFAYSGAGSEVYGHGVYVTEDEATGRSYATIAADNSHDASLTKPAREWLEKYKTFEDYQQDNENATKAEYLQAKKVKLRESGRVLYKVHIPKDNGENYIGWDDKVQDGVVDKVINKIQEKMLADKDYFELVRSELKEEYQDDASVEDEIRNTVDYNIRKKNMLNRGSQLYNSVAEYMGSPAKASEVLSEIGIDGVKVPTGRMSGGNGRGYNYVVFDADKARIVDSERFRRAEQMMPEGETSGTGAVKEAPKSEAEATEESKVLAEHGSGIVERLGGKGKVHTSMETLDERGKQVLADNPKAMGWYDGKTGEVHIVAWNCPSEVEMERTILHEKVGHEGLRNVMGEENYKKFLQSVWENLEGEDRKAVLAKAQRNGWNFAEAVDEYMAEKAEDFGTGREGDAPRTGLWAKVKDAFRDVLGAMGFKQTMTEKDVVKALWLSKHAMENKTGNLEYRIRKAAFERRLKNFEPKEKTVYDEEHWGDERKGTASTNTTLEDIAYRTAKDEEKLTPYGKAVRKRYESAIKSVRFLWTEAHQNALKSLDVVQNLIAGGKEKIKDADNALWALNRLGSKNQQEQGRFDREVVKPLQKTIQKVMPFFDGKNADERYNETEQYVGAKTGLERNRVMYVNKQIEKQKADYKAWTKYADDYQKESEKQLDKLQHDDISDKEYLERMEKFIMDKGKTILPKSERGKMTKYAEGLNKERVAKNITDDQYLEGLNKYLEDRMPKKNPDDLASEYQAEKTRLYTELANGNITYRDYINGMDAWIKGNLDAGYNAGEHDYSGLSDYRKADNEEEYRFGDGKTYDDEAVLDHVMNCEGKMGKDVVDELWGNLKALTNYSLQKDYESGITSKRQNGHAKEMFNFYMPLRGFAEDTAEDTWTYMNNGSHGGGVSTMKKTEGRITEAKHPIATAIAMGDASIMRGNRNAAKQALLRLVRANENDLIRETEVIYEKTTNPTTGEDELIAMYPKFEDGMSADEIDKAITDFKAMIEATRGLPGVEYITEKQRGKMQPLRVVNEKDLSEHTIRVKVYGETKTLMVFGHPRVAQAVNGMLTNSDWGSVGKKLKSLNSYMSQLNTSYSLTFIARNAARDFEFACTSLEAIEGSTYTKQFAKNYAMLGGRAAMNMVGKHGENAKHQSLVTMFAKYKAGTLDMTDEVQAKFKEFVDNGGVTGYVQLRDVDAWQKKMNGMAKGLNTKKSTNVGKEFVVNAIKMYGEGVATLNEAVENQTRFAAYLTSRQNGRTVARSINDAKEVSVNFNKTGAGSATLSMRYKGETGWHYLNRVIAGGTASYLKNTTIFYNAGVQGMARAYTTFTGGDKKQTMKAVAGFCAAPFTMGLMLPIMNGWMASLLDDDDDKKKYGENPYEQLPAYERQQNVCMYIGHGRWLKLPVAIELRAMMGIGDLAAGWTYNPALRTTKITNPENKLAVVGEAVQDVTEQLAQITPTDIFGGSKVGWNDWKGGVAGVVVPSVAQAPLAMATNVGWTGTPISRDNAFNENDPAWTKAAAKTKPAYTFIARNLSDMTGGTNVEPGIVDINPAKMQYLIEQTLGGPGKDITGAFTELVSAAVNQDVELDDIPILKGVYRSSTPDNSMNVAKARYYAYVKEATKTNDVISGYKKDGKVNVDSKARYHALQESPAGRRAKVITKMNSHIKELQAQMKDAKTREDKGEIQERINTYMKHAVDMMDLIEENRKKGRPLKEGVTTKVR